MNDDKFMSQITAVVFLVVLMVIGTVGNLLVIYIFGWKIKTTTQNYFFVWLAVFDLISCVVGIPSEIIDIRNYYLYDSDIACKVLKFFLALPPIASINILLSIAIDRYRRVCKPLRRQMKHAHANICITLSTFIAIVASGPALSLFGKNDVKIVGPNLTNLTGYDCSVRDKYHNKLYSHLHDTVFGAAFVIYTVVLLVIYVRVWLEARKHKAWMRRNSYSARSILSFQMQFDGHDVAQTKDQSSKCDRQGKRLKVQAGRGQKVTRAKKMTVIAVAVTIVFIVSYLPHLCLSILRSAVPEFENNQSGAALVVFNIFLRSFFLNSVANVFVYGAMRSEFKAHCQEFLSQVCWCSGSGPRDQDGKEYDVVNGGEKGSYSGNGTPNGDR